MAGKRKERQGMILYYDHLMEAKESLTEQQQAKLLCALIDYAFHGEEAEDLQQETGMLFRLMKRAIDRDAQKYEDSCRKGSERASRSRAKAKAGEDGTERTDAVCIGQDVCECGEEGEDGAYAEGSECGEDGAYAEGCECGEDGEDGAACEEGEVRGVREVREARAAADNRTEQNQTKQNKTEQNKTKPNRAEPRRARGAPSSAFRGRRGDTGMTAATAAGGGVRIDQLPWLRAE